MRTYGAEFDRLAAEWAVIENAHDREHPDRSQCGGIGACTMMRVAVDLEHQMIEALEQWRRGATDPAELPESDTLRQRMAAYVVELDESGNRGVAERIRQELAK